MELQRMWLPRKQSDYVKNSHRRKLPSPAQCVVMCLILSGISKIMSETIMARQKKYVHILNREGANFLRLNAGQVIRRQLLQKTNFNVILVKKCLAPKMSWWNIGNLATEPSNAISSWKEPLKIVMKNAGTCTITRIFNRQIWSKPLL